MSFLLTGQTDSGKSTIAGNLLYQVGYFSMLPDEDKKAYRNYLNQIEQGSTSKSKYSILMDLLDGEILANKSKTQEFTLCPFEWNQRSFLLVDTPGHQLYIRSLLDAFFTVKQLAVLGLVVSSIPNEFTEAWEKGTTKENMLLGRSIGCKKLLILWNKTDIIAPTKAMIQQVMEFGRLVLRFPQVDSLFVSGFRGDNLLKILDYIPPPSPSLPLSSPNPPVFLDTLYVEGMFFGLHACVISRGFQCILHHHSGEDEIEVEQLFDLATNKPIVILRDNKPVYVMLSSKKAIPCCIGDRVIFRHQKDTLGFGNICLQK